MKCCEKKPYLWKLTSDSRKIWNCHNKFWRYLFPINFSSIVFTVEFHPKITEKTNLYSSQINPNNAMKCTVYGTQKFLRICINSSLTPPSNARDLWNDELGIDLVKKTVSKRSFRNSYRPIFQQQKQPNFQSPKYDELYKLRTAMDYMNKSFLQFPCVNDLPQMNRLLQQTSHKVYMEKVS